MRVVGGDLHRVAVRAPPGLGAADALAQRGLDDRLAHRLGIEHGVDHGAPVRQVGADYRGTNTAKVRAQHARQLARQPRWRFAGVARLGQHLTQADRRREVHDGVAAVEQQRQQTAETADHHPVFREQHAEPAGLAVGRAADVDRHRHHLDVLLRLCLQSAQQRQQRLARGAPAQAAEDQAVAAVEREQRAAPAQAGHVDRPQRRRQSGLAAGAVENQRIRQAVALDHVAHRSVRLQQLCRFGRIALDAQPWRQQAAEQGQPPGSAGIVRARVDHGRVRERDRFNESGPRAPTV